MSATSKGADRRQSILDTAASMFAERGVTATRVREIADEVGILSGSLYHHFASKDEMVQEIILNYLEDLLDGYDRVLAERRAPRQELSELLRTSLRTIERHPHATEIYQNDTAYLATLPKGEEIAALAAKVPETWLATIEAGVASNVFRREVPPRVFYNMLRDALWRSVRWFDPTSEHTREQLAEDYLLVFLEGFATEET